MTIFERSLRSILLLTCGLASFAACKQEVPSLGEVKIPSAAAIKPVQTAQAPVPPSQAPASQPAASAPATQNFSASAPTICDRAALSTAALQRGTKIAAGVSLKASTEQRAILDATKQYEGKTVRIEGPVRGICKAAGCWASVEGQDGTLLNLKVHDGEIDFRQLLRVGQYVVGEGVFSATGHHGPQLQLAGALVTDANCAPITPPSAN